METRKKIDNKKDCLINISIHFFKKPLLHVDTSVPKYVVLSYALHNFRS